MSSRFPSQIFGAALLISTLGATGLRAWDYDGHRIVTQLALASLPGDFPDFARVPANAERIVHLSNLPDRWRNVDPGLRQSGGSWSDHFIDIEELPRAGLDPKTVPSLRYNFLLLFAAGRVAYAEKFPAIDPTRNADHTREWPGFAPWAITEHFNKLRSALSTLKAYEEAGGTAEEIANAKADAVYVMGVMSHYVGDCAQPLHTTLHYNGWSGENPSGFTTWTGFHSWIDSGLIRKAGIGLPDLAPRVARVEPLAYGRQADGRDPFFVAAMDYILVQNQQVEPLYQLEKKGLLGNGEQPVAPEGRALIEGQLLRGGEMLARTWLTAWRTAPVDTYLRTQILGKRQAAPAGLTPPPPASTRKAGP